MSDSIKHECGIVLMRLLKPLEYYHAKYGSWLYGINKIYLMMEKQRNRGQDGAGLACLKLNTAPGHPYLSRVRSNSSHPIIDTFDMVKRPVAELMNTNRDLALDPEYAKHHFDFSGQIFLGHLRYGTFGKNNIENVHPVMRESNWKTKTLVLAGNFNLTNVDELFQQLQDYGQHPKNYSDTVTILEKIGFRLDEQNELLLQQYKAQGFSRRQISQMIEDNLDLPLVLKKASSNWDGGYVIAGVLGYGDSFVMRDPNGIRPVSYYADDEIIVVASERAVIQTVFNVSTKNFHEITPGHALWIRKNGDFRMEEINPPRERRSCSFERIYFSRGSDEQIYAERKHLGELLIPQILEAIDYDLENTVFSFIPNTAESAFYGMIKGIETYMLQTKIEKIIQSNGTLSYNQLRSLINERPRVEKVAIKDVKLRTFITDDNDRNELVEHVYDVTYGTIVPNKDRLVMIDDSIVRGTTLKRSILKILDRLSPKEIIIVSSSPQIRYPDCYGIDMARLSDFIAFQAVIELLRETGKSSLINIVYRKCKEQENKPKDQIINYVKELYEPFSDAEISNKIAQILQPGIKATIKLVFQSVENLHKACPNDRGDWYFTGDYPTPGGNKVVNKAFINYIEGKNVRAY
ncbi:MAG TPA: amidophosphoribosyltransferase [Salinivirgaceae bacterium]|nr:amidophosphoribosyltransferase [Salinivirgaceae bacterium]